MRSRQRTRVRRWLAGFSAVALIVGVGMMPGASAMAAEPTDMVLDWNLNAVNALTNAPTATPPAPARPLGSRPSTWR